VQIFNPIREHDSKKVNKYFAHLKSEFTQNIRQKIGSLLVPIKDNRYFI